MIEGAQRDRLAARFKKELLKPSPREAVAGRREQCQGMFARSVFSSGRRSTLYPTTAA